MQRRGRPIRVSSRLPRMDFSDPHCLVFALRGTILDSRSSRLTIPGSAAGPSAFARGPGVGPPCRPARLNSFA